MNSTENIEHSKFVSLSSENWRETFLKLVGGKEAFEIRNVQLPIDLMLFDYLRDIKGFAWKVMGSTIVFKPDL